MSMRTATLIALTTVLGLGSEARAQGTAPSTVGQVVNTATIVGNEANPSGTTSVTCLPSPLCGSGESAPADRALSSVSFRGLTRQ